MAKREHATSTRAPAARACAAAVLVALAAAFFAASPGRAPAQATAPTLAQTFGQNEEAQGAAACAPGERRVRVLAPPQDAFSARALTDALIAAANTRLDGRVCFEVAFLDGAAPASGADALAAVLDGRVDIAAPPLAAFDDIAATLRVFRAPFLFRDLAAVQWFQNSGPGTRLKREIDAAGLRTLAFWNDGMAQIVADRPAPRPDALAGLRIATPPEPLFEELLARLGATARPSAFSEASEALLAGRLEGMTADWGALAARGPDAAGATVTVTDHVLVGRVLVASRSFWSALAPELRGEITTAATRITRRANLEAATRVEAERAALVARGFALRDLSPEERAAWSEAALPIWRRLESTIGAETVEAARRAQAR